MLRLLFILISLLLLVQPASADRISLEKDIEDGYLDDYSKIEAAFILSGVTHLDSLQKYVTWYDQLLEKIKTFSFDMNDPVGSAQTVFLYLHNTQLKTYALESTTLADIVKKKEYNCVAATILYNILCEDLSWSCEAFETPTHVYTIFTNFNQKVIVENTSTMGFNIMKNLKAYSRFLRQYYQENEILLIGLDRLYYHENSRGRVITNTELLGLLAYNRAYFARKKNNFKAAYDYVMLAQLFNEDSRSNINFEIGLYYSWGRKLYSTEDYPAAFTVFADALYRYPDNKDFLNNTFACFYKSMQTYWQAKTWPLAKRLIDEMTELEILQKNDQKKIKQYLMAWSSHFQLLKNEKSAAEVKRLLNNIRE